MYKVKEIYYTIQGEGFHTGQPAIFCRFSGCNLWTGREQDREKAICKFCDTDFWGTDGINGGKYSAEELAKKIKSLWPEDKPHPFVVCTGGEPALQLDQAMVDAFHKHGVSVAIETNGTLELPKDLDWICVSLKAGTELAIESGNEFKLVHPQTAIEPKEYEHLDFEHFYLQPLFDENIIDHTTQCINYCKENALWKLSIQTHKYLNIP